MAVILDLSSSLVLHLLSPANVIPVDLRARTLFLHACWISIVPLDPVPLVSPQAEDTNELDTCESLPLPLVIQTTQPVLEIPFGFIFCSGLHSPP